MARRKTALMRVLWPLAGPLFAAQRRQVLQRALLLLHVRAKQSVKAAHPSNPAAAPVAQASARVPQSQTG